MITDADTGEDVGVGYNDAAGNVALSTLVYSYRTVEESTAENPTPGEEATEPGEMPAESEGPGAGEKPAEPEGPAAGESPAPGEGASPAGPEPGQSAEPGQPGEPGGEGGANEPSEPAVPAEPEASQPEVTQPEESVAAGEEPVGADDAEENADAEGFSAEGSVAFEALQFGQPGIYEYRVEEMVGNEPGVSYDTTSYRAVVTVEAASDGSLTARVEHPDGYPSFKNAYTPPTTPPDKPDVPVTPPVTPPENPTTPGNPGTPGNPSNPGTSGKPSTSVPATGDETVGGGVLAGLAAAGAVLMGAGALVWFGRRRKA